MRVKSGLVCIIFLNAVFTLIIPTQELEFLGFLLNSNSMTIRLPPRKAITVKQACENLLNQSNPTIREVARVIGLLVSSLPGLQFGELHYRHLERNKISALTINKGNYDALMSLSAKARPELHWWVSTDLVGWMKNPNLRNVFVVSQMFSPQEV